MDDPLTGGDPRIGGPSVLRVGYVPGVQPDKWLRRWAERVAAVGGPPVHAECADAPLTALRRTTREGPDGDGHHGDGSVGDGPDRTAAADPGYDVVFVREHDDASRSAPPGLLRILLYTETMAVLAARGHELAAFDELDTLALDGERWLDPLDPVTATSVEVSAAVDLVATGVGLLVLPQPRARQLGRKDVVARPLLGAPATRIGIAWAAEREGDPLVDAFVGIVRGRTANSSRGAAPVERASSAQQAGPRTPVRREQERPRSRGRNRGSAPRSRRR